MPLDISEEDLRSRFRKPLIRHAELVETTRSLEKRYESAVRDAYTPEEIKEMNAAIKENRQGSQDSTGLATAGILLALGIEPTDFSRYTASMTEAAKSVVEVSGSVEAGIETGLVGAFLAGWMASERYAVLESARDQLDG